MTEDIKKQKGIFIVYNDKESEYAKALQNLIGKLNGYYAVKCTERKFIKKEAALSSNNKIIFFGETESSKKYWLDSYIYRLDENGIRYGWAENHAFLSVRDLKITEIDEFARKYNEKMTLKIFSDPPFLMPPIIFFHEHELQLGSLWVEKKESSIRPYQYKLLFHEFVSNGLEEFMEA